ncbi:hypothetical protein R3P38DRAFT_3042306 [Favolaschia claudopus]|uniref:F-box domain-containing protein n=1 Tax=Favolaschia claudopus TaxID=2862362 RepID=A0AAW0A7N4_9AGAR
MSGPPDACSRCRRCDTWVEDGPLRVASEAGESTADSYLFCSNDAPLASEALVFQRAVSDLDEHIRQLEAEIRQLDILREEKIRELAATRKRTTEHKAVLSPIRRFPVEILQQIFSQVPYSSGERSVHHRGTSPTRNLAAEEPPWQLGHICRRWRAIAIGFPPLWSKITLHISDSHTLNTGSPFEKVETQLYRSINAPLEFTLASTTMGIISDAQIPKSLDLVIQHCERWQTLLLDIRSSSPSVLLHHLQCIKGRVPNLRRFGYVSTARPPPNDILSTAPNLRSVTLAAYDNPSSVNLPWPQITHFHGGRSSLFSAIQILTCASNLVECGLGIWPGVVHNTVYPDFVAPNLRRLSLDRDTTPLKYLTAPSLTELWIPFPTFSVAVFLERSACALEKLVVDDGNDILSLTSILQTSPTLTRLFVSSLRSNSPVSRSAHRVLLMPGIEDFVCPHLSQIVFGEIPSAEMQEWFEMVEARWRTPSSPLHFVRFIYTQRYGDLDSSPEKLLMHELREKGLDIAVDCGFRAAPDNYLGEGRP